MVIGWTRGNAIIDGPYPMVSRVLLSERLPGNFLQLDFWSLASHYCLGERQPVWRLRAYDNLGYNVFQMRHLYIITLI